MDSAQLQQGIAAKFGTGTDQGCRLLFWYDPEQSFKDAIAELDLPDVTVLDMTGLSIFGKRPINSVCLPPSPRRGSIRRSAICS